MADIFPFRGLRYNTQFISDISQVLCPPYDIISAEQQKSLLEKSPHNMVRLEYGEEQPEDSPLDNKYSRAQKMLEDWLNQGFLLPEKSPSFYLHVHQFRYKGNSFSRTTLLTRVKLEESGVESERKTVYPHEGTLEGPKLDRLNLLRACQSNLSPIFALYENQEEKIRLSLADCQESAPVIQSSGPDGETHNLWAIDKPEIVVRLQEYFFKKALFIADGHHRYETALRYRRERLTAEKAQVSPEEKSQAFDFTLMGLVSMSDPGLLILPVHRIIKGVNRNLLLELKGKLMEYFDIYTFPLNELDADDYISKLSSFIERDVRELTTICCYGLEGNHYFILSLKPDINIKKFMPEDRSPAYCQLEVSILHHLILEGMLGLTQDMNKIAYTTEGAEAIDRVTAGEYQAAFLLRPLAVDNIVKVAQAGDRMPGKSTYFYPKLPTGLVINSLLY